MTTYLEIEEVITDEPMFDGIRLRVPVADKADALAKRPALIEQFYAGKTWRSQLHFHIPNGTCTTEPLP